MREEEKNRSSQDSSTKRFFQKRWVFPAVYIASAAIILSAVFWYQTSGNDIADQDEYDYNATDIAGKKYDPPAIAVNRALENFVMPVTNPKSVKIQKKFYDFNGKAEDQEAALVFYNNGFRPNTGIDITMENGETFEVVAALSGTVTDVREDAVLGNVITIEHDNGVATQYQSVQNIGIKVGEQVRQGQVIAMAGQSLFNEEAGVHVHFEIRKENKPVDPVAYFNKPASSIQEEKPAENKDTVEDLSKQKSVDEQSNTETNKVDPGTGTDSEEEDHNKDSGASEKDNSTNSTTSES